MSLERSITVLLTDLGPAQALVPVVQELNKRHTVRITADSKGKASEALNKANLPFTALDKADTLTISGVLLTGTTPAQIKDDNVVHYGRETEAWLAARERGMPSIAFLDKFTPSESRARFTDIGTGNITFPQLILLPHSYALKPMLMGDFGTDELKRTLIRVTGNPHFDDVAQRAKQAQRVYDERIVPVFLSSENYMRGCGTSNTVLLEAVCKGVGNSARIVLKVHPKDRSEPGQLGAYQGILDANGNGAIDDKCQSEGLVLSLRDDEFCVGANSTLLEYATIGDRLAIVIQPGTDPKKDASITNVVGATPAAYNPQEGADLIKRALEDGSFRAQWQTKRAGYTTDGKAKERIVAVVEEELAKL